MQEDHRDPRAGRAGPGTGWAALGAAAVMLALTVWGRGIALTLAGVLVGPVPALKTAFTLLTRPRGRQRSRQLGRGFRGGFRPGPGGDRGLSGGADPRRPETRRRRHCD